MTDEPFTTKYRRVTDRLTDGLTAMLLLYIHAYAR